MRFSAISIILGAAAIASQLGQVSASPTENWGIMCTDVNLGGTCSGFKSPSNDCSKLLKLKPVYCSYCTNIKINSKLKRKQRLLERRN